MFVNKHKGHCGTGMSVCVVIWLSFLPSSPRPPRPEAAQRGTTPPPHPPLPLTPAPAHPLVCTILANPRSHPPLDFTDIGNNASTMLLYLPTPSLLN